MSRQDAESIFRAELILEGEFFAQAEPVYTDADRAGIRCASWPRTRPGSLRWMATQISFVPPEEMLDTSAFAPYDVGARSAPSGTGSTPVPGPTRRKLRHVHGEFAYLTGFLPGLYASEQGAAA